ncbi:Hypothetical predicted protein [Mytilus galloprovincialis]|uniref:Uncharacterized protein n=1 Tax=Mytilus galloprovincialis TaxID=29158 RepID=A0A8B6HN38_MYTGA|nr:Hypothetical predicted protein [Mytilus galloprovincialis]
MAAPYGQGPPPQQPYDQGPPPQYGPPQPHYGGYMPPQQQQQQQTTVVVQGGQPNTTIIQQRKERFADKICLNLILTCFIPFWPIIWIIMCIVE